MGNNCKSVDKQRKFLEPNFERIFYKIVDNDQRNIAERLHKVVGTKAKRFSMSDYEDTKKCPPPLMPMTEFIKICSRNRPAGIPDMSWDRFVYSLCLECSWIDVQGEVDKRGQVEAENSLSSLGYRLGKHKLTLEEVSGRSTPTFSDSSVEFAGKFPFTIGNSEKSEDDSVKSDVVTYKSNVVSNSLSSLSALSLSMHRPDRSLAKYYSDLSSDEGYGCDKQSNLKYGLSLGVLKCNSFESNKLLTENKISTESNTATEPG